MCRKIRCWRRCSPTWPQTILERVAQWLGEVFGGPKLYSQSYGGYQRMISQHLGKALTEEKRARWVELIYRSAQDAGLPTDPEFQAAFRSYIEWGSRIALENSQPEAKPPPQMPMPRWWWACDATPGSRVSALETADEQAGNDIELPAPGQTVSFDQHIKQLFRERDRKSMKFAFDLWSYEDVRTNAQAILEQVKAWNHAVRRRVAGRMGRGVRTLDPNRHARLAAI